ncbi:hypothetical protein BLOT_011521 [Blomia tropicalis]|nr:hypothetical protein BLOT_011521 [Blomia tropicalis]
MWFEHDNRMIWTISLPESKPSTLRPIIDERQCDPYVIMFKCIFAPKLSFSPLVFVGDVLWSDINQPRAMP